MLDVPCHLQVPTVIEEILGCMEFLERYGLPIAEAETDISRRLVFTWRQEPSVNTRSYRFAFTEEPSFGPPYHQRPLQAPHTCSKKLKQQDLLCQRCYNERDLPSMWNPDSVRPKIRIDGWMGRSTKDAKIWESSLSP